MKVHDQKRKSLSLFKSNYIQLQSVVSSSTLRKYTIQAVLSKKKKRALKKEGEKEQRGGKEEKKKKMMERVYALGKEKGRMRCEKKKKKGRKRE